MRVPRFAVALIALAATSPSATASAAVVDVDMTVTHKLVKVAPGVRMQAWTFNGRVPGPVVRVREGDIVNVTLRNDDHAHRHSIDFHAAQIAPDVAFADVAPGEETSFSFVAERPGVWMYHCGTSSVLEHIGRGLYGAIVVEPAAGYAPAQEVVLVQGEMYGRIKRGVLRPSLKAMLEQRPRFVAFNGQSLRYVTKPIRVAVGEPVRIQLVNAGPDLDSAFHVVGEIFDTVRPDGNPATALTNVSTQLVPAGGAATFELTFDEPGSYPFVSHKMGSAARGAFGKILAK